MKWFISNDTNFELDREAAIILDSLIDVPLGED